MSPLQGRALVAAMCVAQVCNLLPHVVVLAIMANHLIPLWHLSAAQAGLMASAYAFGYMLAVPVLTALSDHFDARRILLAGSAVSGLATIGFGILADGLWFRLPKADPFRLWRLVNSLFDAVAFSIAEHAS
jgi:predicted MFS family arabinose efflux permease